MPLDRALDATTVKEEVPQDDERRHAIFCCDPCVEMFKFYTCSTVSINSYIREYEGWFYLLTFCFIVIEVCI